MVLLIAIVGACLFGVLTSVIINWASGRSPLWNVGFGLVAVLAGVAMLLVVVVLLIRLILNPSM